MHFTGTWRLWLSSKSHTSPSNSVHTWPSYYWDLSHQKEAAPSLSTWWAPTQCTAQRDIFNLLPHSLVLCALLALQVTLPCAVFAMKFTNWQKYSLRPKDMSIFGLITGCKRVWFCRFCACWRSKWQENCPATTYFWVRGLLKSLLPWH